jgi:hypothetical protein
LAGVLEIDAAVESAVAVLLTLIVVAVLVVRRGKT